MKKKVKEPTQKDIMILLLTGIGLISFGLIFIWIPFFSSIALVLGGFLTVVGILTFITKVLK